MSSFLSSTANITHSSRLPKGTTRAQALSMLSDYEFFLSCDPHLDKFERIADPAGSLDSAPSVPDSVKSQLRRSSSSSPDPVPTPTCYRVTDIVHAIPAGIWDTNVVSTYEFTDIKDGLFVRIRSPLSIVMDTFWQIREVEGEDGLLELVEDVNIQCSRLLIGLVKSQCENGWAKIHAKMISRLEEEGKTGSG
ncbi:hypothetical protein N656DRAFT_774782 [Canariomyces notabilis]|uniref:DUF7053 domain-containing protein n=1 Tax=Canariomyces notabilis TaxID=2074819 RepID=A0AAN6TL43_9PEZI|nr:hypothetical protein N656DRAFT_774782 [Canariomyces arenarius]